jgi:hypothetical protein
MASNRKSGIPSTQRDPLTGEPLRRGTLRIRVRDYDRTRHKDYQTPIPYRLHCRAEETVDRSQGDVGNLSERLGSNAYAPAFQRYLDEGQRSEQKQAREWWAMPYVLDRLAIHAQHTDARFTLDEMNIALAWYRGADLADAGLSHYWIERARRRVTRYVTKHFMPREQ